MKLRQWHAQLDIFDTMRRYLAILQNWNSMAPRRDRLFVSDFYLLNPSLLHLTQMSLDARRAFNSLKIPRPDEAFLEYPSPPLLYNKMAGTQTLAVQNLIGRGLCDLKLADRGLYQLNDTGKELAASLGDRLVLSRERGVLRFITNEFASVGIDKGGLRSATGLRRIGT
ncbi:ABC-three component system middle component 5 [Bradyrhizobium sp. 62B]|uniref:ABC-three component system middle component 5 n=1 Tax=Bradyrhizobium sp. 62B TaxID=2898442 RepID=UPI002557D396|nr:ABC-three component system middle component 5 [Bradyrhizobium sp. 62B]